MNKVPKQTRITRKRLNPYILGSDLTTKLLEVEKVFLEWKEDPETPNGCLNIGYLVRTNIHRIPTMLEARIYSALERTPFEINVKKKRFKWKRREILWKDSIHLGDYIRSLPITIDRAR